MNPPFSADAFGSPMSNRSFNATTSRYGFNGQEKDNEVASNGSLNTAMFWEYDTRLGRRWNIDPVVKTWESSYACFGNNPVCYTDINGDDFVNAHTKRKEKAKGDVDDASSDLKKSKDVMSKYDGLSKTDIKNLKKTDKAEYNNYKDASKNLKSAQSKFDKATAIYNQEVESEAIVKQVLEDFQKVNPEKYAQWDKFNPSGNQVIDITISAQKEAIQIYRNGEPTGQTTTEGIQAFFGGKIQNPYVNIRLQISNVGGVLRISSMTAVMVHALGHIDGGKSNDENAANAYAEKEYYDKKKK